MSSSARVCLAGVAVLTIRRRREGRPLRRSLSVLIDVFALGLVMIAVLFLSHVFGGPALQQIRWAAFATLALAPLAFLAGLLHDRLTRTRVADFFVDLRADPSPAHLRDALARALQDPSLALVFWLPEFGCYADLDGMPMDLPDGSNLRESTVIHDRVGDRVAALIHDPALKEEPELLAGVTAAAGIALENSRLQAELQARLQDLRGSRARVFEAGRKERQRLERNLHDGAQQRLIALSLELGVLQAELDSPGATQGLDHARTEIATSLAELREIARGLHPAVVTAHGLEVALEQLAARAPVPVHLTVSLERTSARSTRGRRLLPRVGVPRERREVRRRVGGTGRGDRDRQPGPGRDRRRWHRRRRPGPRDRPARSCGSRRGPRRQAAHLEPGRGRHPDQGGDAVRAVMAEDSVLLREGLTRLLVDNGIDVVGTCETAEELLTTVRTLSPDVAIVDIRLPPTHKDEGLRAALGDPGSSPVDRRARAVAVRRGGPGHEAPRRLG